MERLAAWWTARTGGGRRSVVAVDGLLAVVLGALALQGSWASAVDNGVRLGAAGYALVVVAAAGLVVRRVWPAGALAGCFTATAVYLGLGYPYSPILQLTSVAMYSLAAWRSERASAVALAVTAAVYLPLGWWAGGTPWPVFDVVPLAAIWLGVPWLAGVAVRAHRRVRARAAEAESHRSVYRERLRIAQEVHDVVGHSLAVINMQAGVALHVLERRPERAAEALRAMRETSGQALAELRATLEPLSAQPPVPASTPGSGPGRHPLPETEPGRRPSPEPSVGRRPLPGLLPVAEPSFDRRPLPGLGAVAELVESVERGGLRVALTVDGVRPQVPVAVDLAGYRIVQESLTNVVRHAGPCGAAVRVVYGAGEIRVSVTDDGCGGRPREGGRGLTGMRERATALGGTFRAGPVPTGGFEVHAVLPCPPEAGS